MRRPTKLQLQMLKPRVRNPDEIQRIAFLRSLFWQGAYGCGFPSWKDDAEYKVRYSQQERV
jgi:hypothetical protein